MNLNRITYKTLKYLDRNSSTILTIFGVFGVVGTAVLAAKATPKVVRLLETEEYERKEELTTLEKVQIAAPHYIPATLVGISTISCIIGSNVLNKRYQSSLLGAYGLLNESYKSYRDSANNVFGPDADNKICMDVAHKKYISSDGYSLYDPDTDESDLVLFYDSYSERYFKSTMGAVINAQYHLNRNFMLRGEATINEFYTFLGLDLVPFGDNIGWGEEFIEGGCIWIDFENYHSVMDDGLECYIVSGIYPPELMHDADIMYPR